MPEKSSTSFSGFPLSFIRLIVPLKFAELFSVGEVQELMKSKMEKVKSKRTAVFFKVKSNPSSLSLCRTRK